MNYYRLSLAEIKLLSDIVAQLDHVKNLLPEGCPAFFECAALIDPGHDALTRALGEDEALVYAPEIEPAKEAA